MARLNIEDSFWLEVTEVIAKVGDRDLAIGNALRFFRHAQEKHKNGELISEDDFKRQGFLEALIPTFAERVDGGIVAVGADKHFGWLMTKSEAGSKGGKKSAQRPRDAQGRLLPKEAVQAAKHDPSKTKLSQASSSLSSSPSSETRSNTTDADPEPGPSGTAGGDRSIYQTPEELKSVISPIRLLEWETSYPDAEFREQQLLACFLHWSSPGKDTPRALRGWEKAISAWYGKQWQQRGAKQAIAGLASFLAGKKAGA